MIKRYEPHEAYHSGMEEWPDGDYVTYEDYLAAMGEIERLRKVSKEALEVELHMMTVQDHLTEKVEHFVKVKDALVDRLFDKDELIKDLNLIIDKLKEVELKNEKELWSQSRKLKQKQVRIEDLLEAAKSGGVS